MRTPGGRRRQRARTLTAAACALAVIPVTGTLAQDAGPEPPTVPAYSVMIAKTTKSKQSVQGKQGSFCLPKADGTGGVCHTARFPLPDPPVVRVSKGEQVTLLFKVPVGYVTWRTARVSGKTGAEVLVADGEGEQVTKTKKRWRVTLPRNMRRSVTILGLFVQYANAYNSFEVGLKVR